MQTMSYNQSSMNEPPNLNNSFSSEKGTDTSVKEPNLSFHDTNNNETIPDTDSEKAQTETITKQLSVSWTGNGHDNLQKSLSTMYQEAESELKEQGPTSSFAPNLNDMPNEYNGMDTMTPLVKKQSALLSDDKNLYMLNHNSSSNLQIPYSLRHFSRNTSLEGASFMNFNDTFLSPDLTMNKIPSSMQYSLGGQTIPMEPDRYYNTYISNDPAVANLEINRMDSLQIEQLTLNDMKRQRSYTSTIPSTGVTKITRQNTDMRYVAPLNEPSQSTLPSFVPVSNVSSIPPVSVSTSKQIENQSKTEESEPYHRILTAEVNGVNYTTEIKKKDKRNPHKWTSAEDDLLRAAVNEFGEKRWKDIASRIPGRNHVQCLQRWKKVLKPGLKKGHWTEDEDYLLRTYKDQCGNWAEVAEKIPGRTPKQCRERWYNHVNPEIRKGEWTSEEDNMIVSLQEQWGNRWSSIAEQLPGRSENSVKIRWKTLCRRGIPELHAKSPKSTKPSIKKSETKSIRSTMVSTTSTQRSLPSSLPKASLSQQQKQQAVQLQQQQTVQLQQQQTVQLQQQQTVQLQQQQAVPLPQQQQAVQLPQQQQAVPLPQQQQAVQLPQQQSLQLHQQQQSLQLPQQQAVQLPQQQQSLQLPQQQQSLQLPQQQQSLQVLQQQPSLQLPTQSSVQPMLPYYPVCRQPSNCLPVPLPYYPSSLSHQFSYSPPPIPITSSSYPATSATPDNANNMMGLPVYQQGIVMQQCWVKPESLNKPSSFSINPTTQQPKNSAFDYILQCNDTMKKKESMVYNPGLTLSSQPSLVNSNSYSLLNTMESTTKSTITGESELPSLG